MLDAQLPGLCGCVAPHWAAGEKEEAKPVPRVKRKEKKNKTQRTKKRKKPNRCLGSARALFRYRADAAVDPLLDADDGDALAAAEAQTSRVARTTEELDVELTIDDWRYNDATQFVGGGGDGDDGDDDDSGSRGVRYFFYEVTLRPLIMMTCRSTRRRRSRHKVASSDPLRVRRCVFCYDEDPVLAPNASDDGTLRYALMLGGYSVSTFDYATQLAFREGIAGQ